MSDNKIKISFFWDELSNPAFEGQIKKVKEKRIEMLVEKQKDNEDTLALLERKIVEQDEEIKRRENILRAKVMQILGDIMGTMGNNDFSEPYTFRLDITHFRKSGEIRQDFSDKYNKALRHSGGVIGIDHMFDRIFEVDFDTVDPNAPTKIRVKLRIENSELESKLINHSYEHKPMFMQVRFLFEPPKKL